MRIPLINETLVVRQKDGSFTKEKVKEIKKNYMLLTAGLCSDVFEKANRTFEIGSFMLKGKNKQNVQCFYEEDIPKVNDIVLGQIFYIIPNKYYSGFMKIVLSEIEDEHFVFKNEGKLPTYFLYTRRTLEPFIHREPLSIQEYPCKEMLTKNLQLNKLYTKSEISYLLMELDKYKIIDQISSKINLGKYEHLDIDKLSDILNLAKN
jgi:hypothetical protein